MAELSAKNDTYGRSRQLLHAGDATGSRCLVGMEGLMHNLDRNHSAYNYTVYRCAMKFRALQDFLNVSHIPYKLVLFILRRHDMILDWNGKGNWNLMIPPFQLTSLLQDIYLAANMLGQLANADDFDLEKGISLCANFFWNVFDPNRRYSVSLLEIQLTFLLLCKLHEDECQLSSECFALVAAYERRRVSKLRVECMFKTFIKIFTFLGESVAYGIHNLTPIMEQCFGSKSGAADAELTERQFQELWTRGRGRFAVYVNLIALTQRLRATEQLVHNYTCESCRTQCIVGLRFKCQSCRELSLCLKCFAAGYTSDKHTVRHRVCEVFTEGKPRKRLSHYLARLCGKKSTQKATLDDTKSVYEHRRDIESNSYELKIHSDRKIDSVLSMPESNAVHSSSINVNSHNELKCLARLTATAMETSELMQNIIQRLLRENAELEVQLKMLAVSTHADIAWFLETHKSRLIEIIDDMRSLARSSLVHESSLTSPTIMGAGEHISSTPNHCSTQRLTGDQSLAMLYDAASSEQNLTHSIDGAELNRSYVEANQTNYSLRDVSFWFSTCKSIAKFNYGSTRCSHPLESLDTGMTNFRKLLRRVKEIVDDSYSDNVELSEATQHLECVLDVIILKEEEQRKQMSEARVKPDYLAIEEDAKSY